MLRIFFQERVLYLFKDVYILNPTDSESFDFFRGSLLVEGKSILKIFNGQLPESFEISGDCEVVEGKGTLMIFPGFIQTHIHLCQTLYRNRAENMALLPWLKEHIWPYEAKLTKKTIGQSVILSLKEILSSGTTAVLDMGTVRHTDVIFEIMEIIGFRYTGGKAMMDAGEGVPADLAEKTDDSINESVRLYEKFHNKNNGMLKYCFAPRFVLSCTDDLLKEVRKLSDHYGILIETHGSEHKEEVEYIRSKSGFGNISYLYHIGALNERSVIAHTVHLDEIEVDLIRNLKVSTVHCPSTNLKLGSGIAPVYRYLQEGIKVGIGADGAPCNNALNIFSELKVASLLQKGLAHNAKIMTAKDTLRLATINSAKILGIEGLVGRLKEGMDADIVVLDMDTPQTLNFECHPSAAVVYGCDPRNVKATMVAGKFLFRDGQFSQEINDLEKFFNEM